mmetsp:Transcript_2233/g.8633  ORF Transcript_2233/g.8633 Transcript_2233/m.8633 type:complete len:207 (-) Transcript_2233:2077-2697(-)
MKSPPSGRSAGLPLTMRHPRVLGRSVVKMLTMRAMAEAVVGWSPVTITTRIPARWHESTASGTAGRGGSMRATMPTKTSFLWACFRKSASTSGSSPSDRRASMARCTSVSLSSPMGKFMAEPSKGWGGTPSLSASWLRSLGNAGVSSGVMSYLAKASTRRPLRIRRSRRLSMSLRSDSLRSTVLPSLTIRSQRPSTRSGAPFIHTQ